MNIQLVHEIDSASSIFLCGQLEMTVLALSWTTSLFCITFKFT